MVKPPETGQTHSILSKINSLELSYLSYSNLQSSVLTGIHFAAKMVEIRGASQGAYNQIPQAPRENSYYAQHQNYPEPTKRAVSPLRLR